MVTQETSKIESPIFNLVKEPDFKVREGLFSYTNELIEQARTDSWENLMQNEQRSEIILVSAKVLKNFLTKGWSCHMNLNMDEQKKIVAVSMVEHGGHFDQDLIDFVQSTKKSREIFNEISGALNMRMHVRHVDDKKLKEVIEEWNLANKILLDMPISTRI